MKRFIFAVAVCILCSPLLAQDRKPWDYKVVVMKEDILESEKQLKELGEMGWEMVGVANVVTQTPVAFGAPTVNTQVRMIFKRATALPPKK